MLSHCTGDGRETTVDGSGNVWTDMREIRDRASVRPLCIGIIVLFSASAAPSFSCTVRAFAALQRGGSFWFSGTGRGGGAAVIVLSFSLSRGPGATSALSPPVQHVRVEGRFFGRCRKRNQD